MYVLTLALVRDDLDTPDHLALLDPIVFSEKSEFDFSLSCRLNDIERNLTRTYGQPLTGDNDSASLRAWNSKAPKTVVATHPFVTYDDIDFTKFDRFLFSVQEQFYHIPTGNLDMSLGRL